MNDLSTSLAADYADALFACRRARTWAFWIVLAMLLGQGALFFTARYSALLTTHAPPAGSRLTYEGLHYLVSLSAFLGLIVAAFQVAILLLLVNIMLVGRLIGLRQVVGALLAAVLLLLLLFPWQGFLASENLAGDFEIPGVLYTWSELTTHARFAMDAAMPLPALVLKWARFVGVPALAIVLLIHIHVRGRRGLRMALGEEQSPDVPAA